MFVIQLIQLLLVTHLGLLLVLQLRSGASAEQQARPSSSADSAYAPPSHAQQLWALGTCAVLADINGQRHDLLGGSERTPAEINRWRDCLAKWWGVRSRAELLETLRWLDEDGHRREFNALARVLSQASATQLDAIQTRCSADPTLSNRVELIRKYQKELGAKGILAWDYGRYVSLCGWGYIVGFLTEDEAWRKIMPVAGFLQDTFDSWDDLGRSYVIGREFWSFEKSNEARKAYKRLLTLPGSPWTRLPWTLDLKPTASDPGRLYDYGAFTNFVEVAGRPLSALVPTAQWTWQRTHSNDAAAELVLTVSGLNLPVASVNLRLKRCATQPGPARQADNDRLLDKAPWDSVCKGGWRAVSLGSVSTNGIRINVNEHWGPASLMVREGRQWIETSPGKPGEVTDMPCEFASHASADFMVPYTPTSSGRIGNIFFTAKWIIAPTNARLSAVQ